MLIKQLLPGSRVGAVPFKNLGCVHQVNTFGGLACGYVANNLIDSCISTESKRVQLTCFNISVPGLVIFTYGPITAAQSKLQVGVTIINPGGG